MWKKTDFGSGRYSRFGSLRILRTSRGSLPVRVSQEAPRDQIHYLDLDPKACKTKPLQSRHTWPSTVCKTTASWADVNCSGPCFYMLLGSRSGSRAARPVDMPIYRALISTTIELQKNKLEGPGKTTMDFGTQFRSITVSGQSLKSTCA